MNTSVKTLATGAELTPETFADFIERLRYHCNGEGVERHGTADAIFIVQAKQYSYGFGEDYGDGDVIYRPGDDGEWFSIAEFWKDSDEEEQIELNRIAAEDYDGALFVDLQESQQWDVIDQCEFIDTTRYAERWEYVCSHFTQEAAEAFIARKKHDYRRGLRIFVDAQLYCWEWNAIKEALLDGRIVLKGGA